MTTKRLFTTICTLALTLCMAMAQGPNDSGDYYMNADGLKGQKLKTALSGIINKHNDIGYAGLWNAYKTTDRRPDGFLRDWYSNATSYVIGGPKQGANYSDEGDSYNREHLVPQSWFSKASPMRNDAFHVVPTDGYVNNRRGDLPFGEVGTVSYHSANNYSLVGRCKVAGYSGQCFEPNDEIKGDVARAYFYMTTCYENNLSSWSGDNCSYCFDGTTYPALTDWFLQMLMAWSERDPVDEVELERNEAVAALQKNRNPFIDYPGLEQYIWGSKQNEPFDYTMQPGDETATVRKPYFTPTGGIFAEALTVTIVSPTDGTTVYYTSDGTTPTTKSTAYTAPITIEETTTLKAIAAKDDAVSHVAVATYVIKGGDDPTPSGEILLWESFSGYTSTSDGSANIDKSNENLDFDGWTSFTKVFLGKNGCGKLGTSSASGSMEAKNIALTGSGILTFKIQRYSTDSGKLNVTITGATAEGDLQVTPQSSWTEYTVTLSDAKGSVGIKFATSTKRAYIDDIKLVSVAEEPATTPGDIVKDGTIDWNDLKALVKILLGITPAGENIDSDAANVNGDDETNIADVTKLVNKILQNNQ